MYFRCLVKKEDARTVLFMLMLLSGSGLISLEKYAVYVWVAFAMHILSTRTADLAK